jgi:hypothetical protein
MKMSRLLYQCAQIGILLVLIGSTRPTTAQDARFVPLADGSGVQDTTTGLIWGYALADVDRFLTGDQTLRDWSFTLAMWVMTPDGQGGHTVMHYQDFSNTLYGRQDTDWRIPTKDEIVQAVDGGLLLALDGSPAAGFQAFDPTTDWLWWSSTSAGKVKGFDYAYEVNVLDGSVRASTVTSYTYGSIPVRGVAPPPPPTKGGKK